MTLRRDSLLWKLGFISALIGYGAAHTPLVPDAYVELVKDTATLIGCMSGWLRASPLGPGRVKDIEG